MNRNDFTHALGLLLLASTTTMGCGDGTDVDADAVDLGDAQKPRVEHVQLTRLEKVSADAPTMLHPVKVELELDVSGEAFDSDVLVGLTADDGALGCVLGAIEVKQDEQGASHHQLASEFFVNADCRRLIDRDDVELFAAFDPWGDTEVERDGAVIDEPTGIYDIVRGSMLGTDDCEGCRTATALLDSPGPDAQLREVSLGSSVAVLSLPASEDQVQMPAVDTPHFEVSSGMRLSGVARDEAPRDGETLMTYDIRPLAGAAGTEGLDRAGEQWAPLLERRRNDDGEITYSEAVPLAARGQVPLMRASAVYIGDDVAARMGFGDWQGVEEFELRTCVSTTFEQAQYEGESAPRDNDCAVLPVVVVRQYVEPNGAKGIEAGDALAGGAKARAAEVWDTSWSTTDGPGESGVSFETWIDINASEEATTTYGGRPVNGAGSWFEAGAFSEATVFSNTATLLDAYVTLIGYDAGGGGISLGVEAMGFDVVDAINIDSNAGITLTLEQILQAAGASTTTTWSDKLTLVGYSFDDGCGTVEAGIFLEGEIGIDNQATSMTVTTSNDGVSVSGTITPTAGITAVSKAEAAYNGFISFGVELAISLEIMTITLPFTATATVDLGTPSLLTFNETATLGLSSLSGAITYSFWYEFTCWGFFTCEDDHSHTLVSWDGIYDEWILFDWTQQLQFGTGASFCDNYGGKQVSLRTAHDKYVGPAAFAPDILQGDSQSYYHVDCQPNGTVALRQNFAMPFQPTQYAYIKALGSGASYDVVPATLSSKSPVARMLFTPVAQSDGSWALETYDNRYLRAGNGNQGWEINTQTYVGGWEKLAIVPK